MEQQMLGLFRVVADVGGIRIGSTESTAAAFLPGFLSSFQMTKPHTGVR